MTVESFITRKNILSASAGMAVGIAAAYIAGRKEYPPLETASYVNLSKYIGEWYEIARLPAPFERKCTATKARYDIREDGSIDVLNTCHKGSPDGKLKSAHGRAVVVEPTTNAKLKVQFFWPFTGDYWILDVGDEYEYALVGAPSRKYLWILNRTPKMAAPTRRKLITKAKRLGFDTDRLIVTEQ